MGSVQHQLPFLARLPLALLPIFPLSLSSLLIASHPENEKEVNTEIASMDESGVDERDLRTKQVQFNYCSVAFITEFMINMFIGLPWLEGGLVRQTTSRVLPDR